MKFMSRVCDCCPLSYIYRLRLLLFMKWLFIINKSKETGHLWEPVRIANSSHQRCYFSNFFLGFGAQTTASKSGGVEELVHRKRLSLYVDKVFMMVLIKAKTEVIVTCW